MARRLRDVPVTNRECFLAIENEQVGPVDVETVRAMARDGVIGPSTLVWFDGLGDWVPLSSTDLRQVLDGIAAPPPMHPQPGAVPPGGAARTTPFGVASFRTLATAAARPRAGSIAPGPILDVGFVEAIRRGLMQYIEFGGRASRSEYWWFTLFSVLVAILLGWSPVFGFMAILALVIPGIAVTVRRLHDTDRVGWWYLLYLLPVAGAIVLLIFFVQPSQPTHNRFG